MTGLWVAAAAIAVALVFGAYRLATDGRFSTARRAASPAPTQPAEPAPAETPASAETTWTRLAPAAGDAGLGARATLVQFSSAFCAPCRATRRILEDVARTTDGVVHVEVDAEQHLDIVRRLDIRRTPTTLVLDREGNEIVRAAGAPRREQVLGALP